MKTKNPFDTKLHAQAALIEPHIRDALVEATDTLDFCWAAVQAVFERKATPELAMAMLPIVMQHSTLMRQQAASEWTARMEAAASPAAPQRGRKRPPKAS